jgi:hypothetical protein
MDTIDFSSVLAGVSVATIITAIIGAGVLKVGPNFAKWGVNKLASFFK